MAGERLQTRFARHGLTPQRAPKQCPIDGAWRMLWGRTSRQGLLDMAKKHMGNEAQKCPEFSRLMLGRGCLRGLFGKQFPPPLNWVKSGFS